MTTRSLFPTIDRLISVDRELDRAFNEMYGNGSLRRMDQAWIPAMDIAERPDGYVLAAELPGVDPESVDVSFDGGNLVLRGSRGPSFPVRQVEGKNADADAVRVLSMERVSGAFERTLRLPGDIDPERIEATYEHGVLWITVPKADSAKPRRIAVKGLASSTSVRG